MILQLIHVFQTTGIIEKHFNLKFHQMGNSEKINVSIILLTLFRNRGGLCLMKSPKNMCQNLHISLDKENPNSFYHFEPH